MSWKRCRWARRSPSCVTVGVVQQGTPDDLYDRPADLYVASKIGSPHMNMIDVEVRGDGASLDTPFGVIAGSFGCWRASAPGSRSCSAYGHGTCGWPREPCQALCRRCSSWSRSAM